MYLCIKGVFCDSVYFKLWDLWVVSLHNRTYQMNISSKASALPFSVKVSATDQLVGN
jgi:hypothetical protein